MVLTVFLVAPSAHAQNQDVWIQIDTQPSLKQAEESIRRYSAAVLDVNGFSMGSGWYAVALGPYARQDAELVLRNFTTSGVIPSGSFLTSSASYHAQFWPVGADVQTAANTTEIVIEEPVQELQATAEPQAPEETKQEARASENLLTREEKMDLQEKLEWAGFYNGAIDAAFGRGTRG